MPLKKRMRAQGGIFGPIKRINMPRYIRSQRNAQGGLRGGPQRKRGREKKLMPDVCNRDYRWPGSLLGILRATGSVGRLYIGIARRHRLHPESAPRMASVPEANKASGDTNRARPFLDMNIYNEKFLIRFLSTTTLLIIAQNQRRGISDQQHAHTHHRSEDAACHVF